jgi:hypothetical protein
LKSPKKETKVERRKNRGDEPIQSIIHGNCPNGTPCIVYYYYYYYLQKQRTRRQNGSCLGDGYLWEVEGCKERGKRVNMVEIISTHVYKKKQLKNETC